MNNPKKKTEVASTTTSARGSNGRGSTSSASNKSNSGGQAQSNKSSSSSKDQYPYRHFLKWGNRGSEDDSVHYLSEPSLSEEGDSTTDHHRSLLSEGDEDTDDRGTPPPPPPGPPPPSSAASNGVASPGNTSLSSWESHFRPSHPNHRVRIHFSPETSSSDHHQSQNSSTHYQHHTQHQAQHLFPPQNVRQTDQPIASQHRQPGGEEVSESGRPNRNHASLPTATEHSNHDMTYSSFSASTMSAVSANERKKLDEFIHGLRQSSEGALQESAGNTSLLNTSTEGSMASHKPRRAGLDTVLRINTSYGMELTPEIPLERTHRRISSVETELIGNTSDGAHMDDDCGGEEQGEQQFGQTIEDSPLKLNLSLLVDEEATTEIPQEFLVDTSANEATPTSRGGGPRNTSFAAMGESTHTTDSDNHHHSADDEQTEFRPPRRRTYNVAGGKPSPVHRRTRSGDSAAAALATGGTDWIGMLKDKIAMPDGDDEDEEDEDEHNGKKLSKDGSPDKSEQDPDNSKNRNGNDSAIFAVGATEATASRAAARKQRREVRQQQRAMAEKAAAVARQQRIQKQYQEWSHSPLWNMKSQNMSFPNVPVDSSETNSLGSVPSTVGLKFPPGKSVSNVTSSSMGMDDNDGHGDAAYPRNSLDTQSSEMSSIGGRHDKMRRRNSIESHNSLFSWISATNHETGDPFVSPSSISQSLPTLKVFPNWTPQSAALSSPRLHQRKPEQQHHQRRSHQRSQSSIVGYPPNNDVISQSTRSQPNQDAFMTYLWQQQQTAADHDSFRRFSTTSPHSSVSFASTRSASFPVPPLMSSIQSNGPLTYSQHSISASSSRSTGSSDSEEDDDESVELRHVLRLQVPQIHPDIDVNALNEAEQSAEAELLKLGSYQHVLRGRQSQLSPFATFGRKIAGAPPGPKKFDRASFLPKTSVLGDNELQYPTYRCPRCQTIQREFFTVNTVPRQYETASGFLALSFVVYVISSLYIFGLEEGWNGLDCIYFAVITLTTAGLGDFVPTTSFNKVICSIFIYFGVACIGLLLGSYIAAMLDESTRRQARENRINACPNCARLQNIKDAAEKRALARPIKAFVPHSLPSKKHSSERTPYRDPGPFSFESFESDESSDDGYRLGNKKIKRLHDSMGELPSMHSPPFSLDQSINLPSSRKTAVSAGEASPFTTTSKCSATSSQERLSTMGKIPEEGGMAEEKETVNPPLSTIGSYIAEGSRMPCSSSSPVSPITPRQTQSTQNKTDMLVSPMTKQILGRQSHTRHASIDLNGNYSLGSINELMGGRPFNARKYSFDTPKSAQTPTITENVPFVPGTSNATGTPSQAQAQAPAVRFENLDDSTYNSDEAFSSDNSSVISSDSCDSYELNVTKHRVRTAKYVFLTLKQALVNSMVIIAVGCLGFWFIEGFDIVDSWYFTTVLLTTVGYGDIVPVTRGGKLFATIYILVAGTILLNNMSLISMIPLELRKRRIERAVLTQFGDLLDDDALRELATGPLIQRLHLSVHRPGGLNECTREMFALAMLVRLGKVTEEDILQTFGAFNRLDVNRDGVLNSKSIIAGMIHKSRSKSNLAGLRRENSSGTLKTPSMQPVYGSGQDSNFAPQVPPMGNNQNIFAPPPAYQAPTTMFHPGADVDSSETSSLFRNNSRGYNSMLSRST